MSVRRMSSRLILALAIGFVLCAGALCGRGLDREIKAHMRDVKSLNLINGLTLQVEQMRGLVLGGVDLLTLETFSDLT